MKLLVAVVLSGALLGACSTANKDAEKAKSVDVGERSTTKRPAPTTSTPKSAKVGSRANPVPLGTPATLNDEWRVTVVGTTPNANAAVHTENQFNDPPPTGQQFFIVRVAATYLGEGSSTMFDLGFKGLDSGNVTYDGSCGVVPDELPSSEVFQNGTITGNVCWPVASDRTDSLLMFADVSFRESRAFFALH